MKSAWRSSVLALSFLLAVPAFASHHGSNPGQGPGPAPVPAPQPKDPQQNEPQPQQGVPPCVNNQGAPMQVNDDQVLEWKTSTPNQFRDRGFIRGTIFQVLNEATGHLHLDVYIGAADGTGGPDTDVEVIYNQDFGVVPGKLAPGMEVIACGDYITSTQQSGPYPASPEGAILHWVHKAMPGESHPSGFLMIDGQLYGQMDAAPRSGKGGGNNN